MKTVFITGASSGLGLSHAIYLSSLGYAIIGTSRHAENLDPNDLKEIFLRDHTKYDFDGSERRGVRKGEIIAPAAMVENVTEHLKNIRFVSLDVTDERSVKRVVEEIGVATPIDVVINNAGYAYWGPVEEISVEEAQELFAVNFFGHIRILHAIIPYMRSRQRGQIINTTSVAALVGIPFLAYYSAAKAGMERITESLYTELKPFDIRVSSLLPGDINTAVSANMIMYQRQTSRYQSTEIDSMIDALPTPNDSPYFEPSKTAWEVFIRNHIIAPPPLMVSRRIAQIIRAKNPKIHYTSGTFLQTTVLVAMKLLLPENMFLNLVRKAFGL